MGEVQDEDRNSAAGGYGPGFSGMDRDPSLTSEYVVRHHPALYGIGRIFSRLHISCSEVGNVTGALFYPHYLRAAAVFALDQAG